MTTRLKSYVEIKNDGALLLFLICLRDMITDNLGSLCMWKFLMRCGCHVL